LNNLREALAAIKLLQQTSGAKEKQRILAENKHNESFNKLLYYSHHPRLSYKVSEKTLRQSFEYKLPITVTFTSIFEVCETLSKRKAVDDNLLYQVKLFLSTKFDEEREIYVKILAKTLRLGVTAKSINKAIPNLIPEWEVQQAYPIEKHPLKEGVWFSVSQKLNGVRATFYRGEIIGRSGAVMTGLDHIIDELAGHPDMVFDGELTLKNKDGLSDNEAFRVATGIINSDDAEKTSICFTIFDALPADEFENGKSKAGYRERRRQLDQLMEEFAECQYVGVLPTLYKGKYQEVIPELLDQMVAEDKEGLMVNLDVPYRCKRHNGILKVKRFYTMDLPIIRCESGTGKLEGTLGAIVVDYQGTEVGVGSGFTDDQRDWLWRRRDEVVGELAEVKYKEISTNKATGAASLQFPVFVGLRFDKHEVSYG